MSNQITWNNQVIRVNKSSVFFFSLVGKKSALNISCAFSTRKVTPWCLLKLSCRNTTSRVIFYIIIWLALWEGKMNQILRCDWLPAVSRKENFRESHIINPLLTKLVWSRLLDIGLILFLRVYGPQLAILTSHLVNNPYIVRITAFYLQYHINGELC